MFTHSMLKIRTAVVVAALSVAFAAPALHAQISTARSQVNVPFAFEAGSAHFAPGTYILSEPTEYVLFLQGAKRSAMTLTSYETSQRPAQQSKMVFHRYGNRYFLREVWVTGKADYISFPVSKAEREVRRTPREFDHAALDAHSDVEIALLDGPR